ncbi:hypothetical protein BDY19DRAFT_964330 [Irpex rosettiformis]|uniref:Uncharacterized protein n=1 Tax=Irpex rosettiformis TaxID=378272 RepID=A0ACB8TUS5_9APHY|nr:hypothetical protein BDY19DRAFT_964330 [Irpex rosettiformis]
MPSQALVVINDASKPANIPGWRTIAKRCFEPGPHQADPYIRGMCLDLQTESPHDASKIWVKFGSSITMGEACTQHYVAHYLRNNDIPNVRVPLVYLAFKWEGYSFIVDEYIDGTTCDNSDIHRIAAAVQALIAIPSPVETPGRVGGGLIEHPFFIDRHASIEYGSVMDLQDHINGILRVTGKTRRVDFSRERGLCLCVSDLKFANFMKDRDGTIVAVDFGGYSFLPPSFFGHALEDSSLAHTLKYFLELPDFPSENLLALMSASFSLVPFGSNKIGLPKRLKDKKSL